MAELQKSDQALIIKTRNNQILNGHIERVDIQARTVIIVTPDRQTFAIEAGDIVKIEKVH